MSNFADYNEQVKDIARFKTSVLYQHIIDNPGITTTQLAKAMYTNAQTIDHIVVNILAMGEFLEIKKVVYNGRTMRGYKAINVNKYNFGDIFKRSKDWKRDYFELKYKDLPEHLKDAIFTGKISSDIVSVYHEGDLDHTYKPHKMKREFVGIPSTMSDL